LIVWLAGAVSSAQAVAGPVDKVVTLLKELQANLDSDEKAEQSVYDKYACWCEETTARKAKNIEDAKDDMQRLGQDILKQKGTVAVRTDEIEEKQVQIKENEEAQETATGARTKENAAWQSESAETEQAMQAINMAMGVLMKATKPALLQQDLSAQLRATVTAAVDSMPMKALAALSPEKLENLRSFAQLHGKASYAPQSMTIQGILSDMYTTMGVDLQEATGLEAKRNRAFEDYMAEKEEELNKLNKILTKKQQEKAEAAAMLAEATESYDDVSKQMNADVEFFDITKKACTQKTADWKERHDLREDEIKGIDAALKILNSDEAKKLFAKSIKPGMETNFLQVGSSINAPKQADLDMLYGKLKAKASASHSLRLASLAAQVRLAKAGHFDKVLKSIDDLIGVLAKEQDSDTKKRDDCEEQYQDIAQESAKIEWKIKNNKAKIQKLASLIEKREDEKTATIKEIKKTEDTIKDMKAERKKENAEFIQAKKDDIGAVALLRQAKTAMLEFYTKEGVKMGKIQGSVKLLQQEGEGDYSAGVLDILDADPMEDKDKAPDASFSGKGKRKGQSKGIVSILTMIIEDLQAEIKNETKNEADAQTSFEAALKAANKLLEDLNATKVSLEQAIAKRKKEKLTETKTKKSNEGDLADQQKEMKSIKTDCDYMMSKYTERAKYRTAEVEALTDAKEFLSNYFDDNKAFVQTAGAPSLAFSRLASPHLRN